MFYSQIIPLFVSFEIIINCLMVTSQMQEGEVCITDSNKGGTCLPFRNCSAALALVQNKGKPKVCSFQGETPIVCCEDVSSPLPIAAEKCLEYRTSSGIKIEYEVNPTLVLGGVVAILLEFPHMVSLIRLQYTSIKLVMYSTQAILGYGNSNDTKWSCGGSLISENFVLTAAHCIYSRYGNVTIVKLGVYQISKTNKYIQVFTVKKTYQHPEYNPLQSYHDIALIELDRLADITPGVKPACLHTSKQLPTNSFTGTGWGATELYGNNSDILRKVNLSYVSHSNCASFYKGQKKFPNGLIDDWQICADGGGARADTCQGDSGGPIQLPQDKDAIDLYTIIGITSVGIKCAIVPAIYTRVSYYVPWIESIVWPN